jgi:TPR repeat protein
MQRRNANEVFAAVLLFGASVLLIAAVGHLCHMLFHPVLLVQSAFAAESKAVSTADEKSIPSDAAASTITVDYPEDGSIFPPEITPPTFLWRDGNGSATSWDIDITFEDGFQAIHISTLGERMRIGEIDPRCISETNQPPSLTKQQAEAHTWTPAAELWATIKRHSIEGAATVLITGVSATAPGKQVSIGRVSLSTSRDPVGAPIFYRDVPLMPSAGAKGVVQPLAPNSIYLINWRLRDISQPQSRVVLHDMPTCANCHSFSADGKTMGMDVDGPGNDKGLYAVVPIRPQTTIRNEDVVAWNTDQLVGKSRVGFMSQVSPDGKYVLTTFAGPQQDLRDSYFVTNFKDYKFLQVFYPTRGILEWYSRATGRRQPLAGADDAHYVQTDGVWSPDGKFIVFARAEARDPFPEGGKPALHSNDEHETQIQYDLYRVPFNDGKGGTPEPIVGASHNGMSNNFPKVSPDGRWIVFVKCRNGQLMRPDSQLYIVPSKGGVARRMRSNTSLMNSWHSFSPNGRWLVFSSKSRSPYTQMYLTHIDERGQDSPAIYVEGSTAANRAVNIPEFVNISADTLQKIEVPAADYYHVLDQASALLEQGKNSAALLEWQKAVSLQPDDIRAQNGLAIALYMEGDFEQAAAHFHEAHRLDNSSAGDVRADCYLGLMYRDGKGVPKDYAQALRLLQGVANRGYAPAQYYLGAMYSTGLGVSRNEVLASSLYRAAAEQGYVDAESVLGVRYRDGQGMSQDFGQAMDWLRKAAEQGNAEAQYNLGEMYERGQGGSQDPVQAFAWFHKAAEKDLAPALDRVGAMYSKGEGVQQNYSEAADWYRKAARHGSANAQLILGVIYHTGQGVTRDDQQAVEWLRKSAEQGNPQAQYYLGTMYGMGQGVKQDFAEAEAWYVKAAEQGSANAQFVLGVMYLSAQGVTQDFAEAYYFLNLASSCTHDERNRSTISQAMEDAALEVSNEQLGHERERATQWLSSHACQ